MVTDAFGITPALARMYRASGQAPVGKRILELNPKHPLVMGLRQAYKNRGADDSSLAETAELLYGTALPAARVGPSSLDALGVRASPG
jgi:molecular chaperone HtpG